MTIAPLYLGSSPKEGFFNLPPKKKENSFIKQEETKSMADKIIDKAISDFKIQNGINNKKEK